MTYVAPQSGLEAYTCPYCGAFARQYHRGRTLDLATAYSPLSSNDLRTSECEHCHQFVIWYKDKVIYPTIGNAPLPNVDMPDDVKIDYNEAASLNTISPKSAAALLRLAIQKLCIHLGGEGKNLNDDIALLVKHGLPVTIQQSLDVVRVIGNNAVHPGQITIEDSDEVYHLFQLINLIVEYMISMPQKVQSLYSSLPTGALAAIKKRDR